MVRSDEDEDGSHGGDSKREIDSFKSFFFSFNVHKRINIGRQVE
jgi:hypothetical protein